MDYPETLATLGIQDTGQRKKNTTQHRKQERWTIHGPHQEPGVNPDTREG